MYAIYEIKSLINVIKLIERTKIYFYNKMVNDPGKMTKSLCISQCSHC